VSIPIKKYEGITRQTAMKKLQIPASFPATPGFYTPVPQAQLLFLENNPARFGKIPPGLSSFIIR
jgi:hypothetical protein